MSNKRVQAVLTYAELNDLLGQTEYGAIEAVVVDPVRRIVRIIFGGATPDGVEPWTIPMYLAEVINKGWSSGRLAVSRAVPL